MDAEESALENAAANAVMELAAANAVMGLDDANAVMELGAASAVMELDAANAVMELGAASAVMELDAASAVMELGAANAVMGLDAANAVMGLGAANAVMGLGAASAVMEFDAANAVLGVDESFWETVKYVECEVLEEASVDGVVKYIKEGKCKNIITLAGAGISTSAGIPDFRSPGSGLYDNLQKYDLPDPQAIFEIHYFQTNPKPFFTLAKELYPGNFKPTICHYFVRLLHSKGLLLRHYTQNIDTLERVAGLPGEKLVEAHGTFHTSHCLDCRKEFSIDWMKEQIFSDTVPTCTECNGIVKPDIVFFGESLPSKFFTSITNDFPQCDLLIIMGSSLAVQPFASLVDRVSNTCPRLLLNREKVGQRDRLMQLLGVGPGLNFDSTSNVRDVVFLTDCDEGCLHLAEKLGWGDELKNLVKEEHKKIDEAVQKEKELKKEEEAEKKLKKEEETEMKLKKEEETEKKLKKEEETENPEKPASSNA